jgi:hypothetical protein
LKIGKICTAPEASRSEDYDYCHISSIPVTFYVPSLRAAQKKERRGYIMQGGGAAAHTTNHSIHVSN